LDSNLRSPTAKRKYEDEDDLLARLAWMELSSQPSGMTRLFPPQITGAPTQSRKENEGSISHLVLVRCLCKG
jgi:hypothetical protein